MVRASFSGDPQDIEWPTRIEIESTKVCFITDDELKALQMIGRSLRDTQLLLKHTGTVIGKEGKMLCLCRGS